MSCARLTHISSKPIRISALCQQSRLGCACFKAESLTSNHDPRRMRDSSPTRSGLLKTAQSYFHMSYIGNYIGFVILLLTLAFFEFSNPIKSLPKSSRDVIYRTSAERASGSWLVYKSIHLCSSHLLKIFLGFYLMARRTASSSLR